MADTISVTPAIGSPLRPGREKPPKKRKPGGLPTARDAEATASTATEATPGVARIDVRI